MKRLFWLVFLALLAGGLYWWGKPQQPRAPAAKSAAPTPVTVALAETRDWPVYLELIGRGEATESVVLKPRIDGQVASVLFREGAAVAVGDLLLRLDPADQQARVRQAEANLARDRALLDKAHADLARFRTLAERQFVSVEKVAEAAASAASAAATLRADEAALDLARQQLAHTQVRAPIAGVAGSRLVHAGASLKANETALLEIRRVHPLWVTFAVPEKHLAALHAARARNALAVEVRTPGTGDAWVAGRVTFLDSALDPATATLRVKAELANAGGRFTPGQFLDVRLRLDLLREVVVTPAEAVQQGPAGSFVYVLMADGTARPRPVELILVRDGRAAFARGLKAGEQVVTDGHSRLTPGGKVKIKEPGAPRPRP